MPARAEPPAEGQLLAIDLGSVRIGLALSCPLRMLAQPLAVLHRRRGPVGAQLAQLIAEHGVGRLVVGRPLQLDGRAGAAVHAAERALAALLAEMEALGAAAAARLPVTWWDERLTTAQAERAMIGAGTRRAARRQAVDMVAAAVLLQSYMAATPPI